MLIEVRRDADEAFRVILRTLTPPGMEIELRVTPFAKTREPGRALSEVSRIIEDLRFCGLSACQCFECVRHQVRAIIGHCQLASCEVSAPIHRKGENETIDARTTARFAVFGQMAAQKVKATTNSV
jgi:hypothetical protein